MKKYPPTLTYNNSTTSHLLFLKFWKMESRIQILNLYILLHHALQFVATEEEHLQSEALHRGLNSGKRRHEERGKWMCCNIGDDNDTCIVVAILSRKKRKGKKQRHYGIIKNFAVKSCLCLQTYMFVSMLFLSREKWWLNNHTPSIWAPHTKERG